MATLERAVSDSSAIELAAKAAAAAMPPLPPRHPNVPLFDGTRVERLEADSFQPSSAFPGLLVRRLETTEIHCEGKVSARIFRIDPGVALRLPEAPARFHGLKLLYVLNGEATYEIEGLAEVDLEKGTLACLPPNNLHRLIAASPDFEVIEFELPLITAILSKAMSPAGPSCATEAMIDRLGPDSFEAIPNFDAAVERYMRVLQEITGGAAKVAVLRANPPHIWDGSPWHIHHNNFICALFTNGTGIMGYEDYGDLPLKTGDFFVQQGEIRHREVIMAGDFEILAFDMPAKAPTTVLVQDKERHGYKTMLFTSAQDAGEAFD